MKTMKRFILLFLLAAIAFVACNDDNPVQTTVDEDKANIQLSLDALVGMVQTMNEGQGMATMELIMGMITNTSPDLKIAPDTRTWVEIMWDQLGDFILWEDIEDALDYDHRFYFSTYVGKYTYNLTTQQWTKTASNDMVFEFPSTQTATSNDMLLTISSYTDVQLTIPSTLKSALVESDDAWLPTGFLINLKKDGTKVLELNLNSATYNPTEMYPTLIDLSAYFAPTSFEFDYSATSQAGTYTYNAALQAGDDNSACGLGVSVDTNEDLFSILFGYLDNDEQQTKASITDPFESATAVFYLNNLRIEGAFNLATFFDLLYSEEEPSLTEKNSWFTAVVYYNYYAVATIEFKEVEGEEVVCIVYKDETYEPALDVIADFMEEMGTIIGEHRDNS